MEENSLFYSTIKDATPMMSQYLATKAQYPGCLLLFRMGDFYEMFFDDAKVASSILNIALTHRGKHLNDDIPMCGIPVAALDNYIGRLVKYGQKVAVCDQIEDPQEAKKRGYKAIVKRKVTRILTAGTIVEDSLLNAGKNNFLMSLVFDICRKTSKIKTTSFATIDISTGDFFVNSIVGNELPSIVELYKPKEILVPLSYEGTEFAKYISSISDATVTFLPDSKFNPTIEKERLERYFKVNTLDSFGITLSNELASCGAVLEYLLITQRENFSDLPIPKKVSLSNYLVIDPATSKSLEITTSCRGEYEYSLLGSIDQTMTSFGARALAARLAAPIVDKNLLEKRLDCVEFFIKNEKLRKLLRETLANCSDFERALNRIRFNKFSPRDIGDIRESLRIIIAVKSIFNGIAVPNEGGYCLQNLKDFSVLLKLLESALVEKLPISAKNSGLIATGYSEELDRLKYTRDHSEDLISDLQAKYVSETGINTLRIKNNAILGWYIEVSLSQKNKITNQFIHRQTLVNNIRYTTEELISLQSKFIEAFEEWSQLEQKLYEQIVAEIMKHYGDISYAIKLLSVLDIYTNFAHIASERNFVRPSISFDPILEIENGRHPVLENHEIEFTCNDCNLSFSNRICLLTGPNMAGKSTYLRQNALIVVLAQIGCYVPATNATIGIVDRLFSRIGASDDIARGRSTFMVEMIETATILNQATEKSFVILDEVGRGTSTYDGLSIAWAVIENLYKINKCRVLFATHYRELTSLQNFLKNIKCKTLKVQEWNEDVIFYHKIVDGVADKSYGIHVASIAGVPRTVIKRATELLKKFESQDVIDKNSLPDFTNEIFDQIEFNYAMDSKIREKLLAIDLNNVSPKNALDILYELKGLLA
ncbi:MAG: DNA mismatch repair protein MutS [Holosporaceae bacterium]|jgi:DNA mismatch repair protein MutS|nr:DNA mismatch repair protein MutS [Holosporaceae bacterium]